MKLRQLAVCTAILLSLMAHAAPQGKCPDDLLGTFAVPPEPSTENITNFAKGLIDFDYQPGQPAFELTRKGDQYFHAVLISGNIAPITIVSAEVNEESNPFEIYTCVAHLGKGLDLVSVNYDALSKEQMQEFTQYISPVWGAKQSEKDIQQIRYYLAQRFEMIGVTSGIIYLPVQKLSTP